MIEEPKPPSAKSARGLKGVAIVQGIINDGVPACNQGTPGRAQVYRVIRAPRDYPSLGVTKGDFVKTQSNTEMFAINCFGVEMGKFGNQLIIVDGHHHECICISSVCEDGATGSWHDIKVIPDDPVGGANQGFQAGPSAAGGSNNSALFGGVAAS